MRLIVEIDPSPQGVELANRESQSSWREFLLQLKQRGLASVEFVVSDDHAGLKKSIAEIVPEAAWQRCYVHLLRNALDYLPRKADDDCMQELRWLYDRRNLAEAQRDLAAWIARRARDSEIQNKAAHRSGQTHRGNFRRRPNYNSRGGACAGSGLYPKIPI